MDKKTINQLGKALDQALTTVKPIAPLSEKYPDMTIEDAYQVQVAMLSHRLSRGARVIGKKIGVTSQAVMSMLNVYQPDFGYLLDDMVFAEGAAIPTSKMIAPRAEGEIAFVLKKDLIGPGVTNADVLAATEGVMACFEIVDSRIKDWKIKIQDTVSDNASCGAFVLGNELVCPSEVDLINCGMVLEKNGEIVATGAGAAALGSPVNAVAWLANTLGRLGIPLKAGEVILSGSLAPLIPVVAGDYLRMSINGVGTCAVRFG